jgi:hypothetical protein
MPVDKGSVYVIYEPILGIHTDATGVRIPLTIPLNGLVTIIDGDTDGNPLVQVEWETKALFIFVIDLHSRGKKVPLSEVRES